MGKIIVCVRLLCHGVGVYVVGYINKLHNYKKLQNFVLKFALIIIEL